MAPCMLTIAIFVGGWAWASAKEAIPKTRAVETTKFIFKLKTPKCENTTILLLASAAGGLERPADREAEHRPLLEERIGLSVRYYGGVEGREVGERCAVRHDGRLQI